MCPARRTRRTDPESVTPDVRTARTAQTAVGAGSRGKSRAKQGLPITKGERKASPLR